MGIGDRVSGALQGVKNTVSSGIDTAKGVATAAVAGAVITAAAKGAAATKDPIPVWFYRALAYFPVSGLIGFDHYVAGSSRSAFAKLIVNLLTFGSWYFYDIIYSMDDKILENQGLMIPFFETILIDKRQIQSKDPTGAPLNLDDTANAEFFVFITMILGTICGSLWGFNYTNDYRITIAAYVVTAFTGLSALFTAYMIYSAVRAAGIKAALEAAGGSGTSTGALIKTVTSLTGGGRPLESNNDFILLGALFLITVSGFALSVVRSKSTLR